MRVRLISSAMLVALFAAAATGAAARNVHRGGVAVHHGGNVHRNVNAKVHRSVNVNAHRHVNVHRNVNVNRVVRPVGAGAWARPYRWAPGGAIAAGAAIGFVSAASVAAWAPAPPKPGLCWYYTDSTKRNGFWDTCP